MSSNSNCNYHNSNNNHNNDTEYDDYDDYDDVDADYNNYQYNNNYNNNKTIIDSYQVFPDYDLKNIDSIICLSDNPKTGLFLKENLHLIDSRYLSKNNSSWVADFILDPDIINLIDINNNFHDYNNDKIVNYLIDNHADALSDSWDIFYNTNDIMVDYMLENGPINYKYLSHNNNIKIVKYLESGNEYCPMNFYWSNLSYNNNDRAVEILLDDKYINKISWNGFSINNNNKAVDYLLKHPDKINFSCFTLNDNDKAVDYLLQNPDKIDWKKAIYNINNKFVDYILDNYTKLNWNEIFSNNILTSLLSQINPKIIDFFFKNYNELSKIPNIYY